MGNNEWYTPAKYIEAARSVMGGIDLDPASCELANRTVKATKYYTQDQNGLMQPWYGRVWCNPPYGRTSLNGASMSHQRAFAEKILCEYLVGNIEQAILLTLGNPNSTWFQPFLDYVVCFYRGTLHFTRPNGDKGTFGFPLAFIYLGSNDATFVEVFSRFGRIVKAIDTPKVKAIPLSLWEVSA